MLFDNDPVLNYQSLHIVLDSYLQKKAHLAEKEGLISPAVVSDNILKHFPQTVIMIGDVDPLMDDAAFLFQRLKDVRFSLFAFILSLILTKFFLLPGGSP